MRGSCGWSSPATGSWSGETGTNFGAAWPAGAFFASAAAPGTGGGEAGAADAGGDGGGGDGTAAGASAAAGMLGSPRAILGEADGRTGRAKQTGTSRGRP